VSLRANRHKTRQGFTLVEVVVVVVVLGILSTVALVGYGKYQANANSTACATNVKTVDAAIAAYKSKHGGVLPTQQSDIVPEYLPEMPTLPVYTGLTHAACPA